MTMHVRISNGDSYRNCAYQMHLRVHYCLGRELAIIAIKDKQANNNHGKLIETLNLMTQTSGSSIPLIHLYLILFNSKHFFKTCIYLFLN